MKRKQQISIDPENEGTFTAFAKRLGMSVQEAAQHVLANRDQYTPARVKQANFARNASKWKHQEGGSVGMPWMQMGGDPERIKAALMARYGSDWERKATPDELKQYHDTQGQAHQAFMGKMAVDYQKFQQDQAAEKQRRMAEEKRQNDKELREQKDAELARRARAIEIADEVKDIDFFSPKKWSRLNLAKAAQGLGERFRFFPNDYNNGYSWFDENLNPFMELGRIAKGMGEAPLEAERTNSIWPYIKAFGYPMLLRTLKSRPLEGAFNFGKGVMAARTLGDQAKNLWENGVLDAARDKALNEGRELLEAGVDAGMDPDGKGKINYDAPAYAQGGISSQGYKANSPDRNNAFNIIPSNNITMNNVPHPVWGMDNMGNQKLMMPGVNYRFPGQAVLEVPVRYQEGGKVVDKNNKVEQRRNDILEEMKSVKYRERLSNELPGQDIDKALNTRMDNVRNVDIVYNDGMPYNEWGIYVPKEYKGEVYAGTPGWGFQANIPSKLKALTYNTGWKPNAPFPDPYGRNKPGTIYLEDVFRKGKTPPVEVETTPDHEIWHSADDGGSGISDTVYDLVANATDPGDAPLLFQRNGKQYSYLTNPSEVSARKHVVDKLLRDAGIYDSRTQDFTPEMFDKMMENSNIKNNSDFQEFYKVLKGNDAEKKEWFLKLMNTIASRGNTNSSNMAQYGGQTTYPQRLKRFGKSGLFMQEGGQTPPSKPQDNNAAASPNTPAPDQWAYLTDLANNVIASGEEPLKTKHGRILLDKATDMLGKDAAHKLLDSMYIYSQRDDTKGKSPTDRLNLYYNGLYSNDKDVQNFKNKVKTMGYGVSQFFRDSPDIDTQEMLSKPVEPGFAKGDDLTRLADLSNYVIASGESPMNTKQGRIIRDWNGDLPVNGVDKQKLLDALHVFSQRDDVKNLSPQARLNLFYNNLQSNDKNVQAFKDSVKTLGGYGVVPFFERSPDIDIQTLVKGQIPANAPVIARQYGGGDDNSGLYPFGVINPFDMDPSRFSNPAFGKATAPVATPTATTSVAPAAPQPPATPSFSDTGLYPYGVINPFDRDPYQLNKTVAAPTQTQPVKSIADKLAPPKLNTDAVAAMATASAMDAKAALAAAYAKDAAANTKPKTQNKWGQNIGAAAAVVGSMSILNNILEAKDRNRDKYQARIRGLGDAKGPVIPGDLDTLRGDYAVNDGYFRPNRYTPVQFGAVPVAATGGGYYDEPTELAPIPEGPMPSPVAVDAYSGVTGGMPSPDAPDIKPNSRVNPNQAAWQAYDYYVNDKGLAPHVAAGIIGNLYQESALKTDVKEKGNTGNGRGIAQWDVRDRWQALNKWAEKNKRDPFDLHTQLDYVLEEPGEGLQALKALEKARTPEEASFIFGKIYERPSDKYARWDVRAGIARKLFEGTEPSKQDMAGSPPVHTNGFKRGGEYTVTPKQLAFILAHGGEIEFL